MPHFIKVCPICQEQFYSTRFNQTFDKVKCKNKARSLNAKVLQALMDKASKGMQVIDVIPKSVLEFIKNNQNLIVADTGVDMSKVPERIRIKHSLAGTNLTALDQSVLADEALKLKRVREAERIEQEIQNEAAQETQKRKNEESLDVNKRSKVLDELMNEDLIDPEAASFDLDASAESSKKYIFPTDPVGTADGFGEKDGEGTK